MANNYDSNNNNNNNNNNNHMGSGAAACLPQALTDFCFDLYDSVTLSQLPEEQSRLYHVVFADLSHKYFNNDAHHHHHHHQGEPSCWPSPQSIASECNGDPLFLAIYRELTHRHWHQVVMANSRPSIRDCIEGWNVYRELFEEVLDSSSSSSTSFYLLPGWTFDILQEFVYQFQGYCQIRSAVYASARKHGLLLQAADGSSIRLHSTTTTNTTTPSSSSSGSGASGSTGGNNNSQQHSTLLDNLNLFENNTDAWDVEIVFSYLHRLIQMGFPATSPPSTTTTTTTTDSRTTTSGGGSNNNNNKEIPAVHTYLSLFSCIALSRLECLLADYTACLHALTPLAVHADYVIPKKDTAAAAAAGAETSGSAAASATGGGSGGGTTVAQVLQSTFTARLSLAYHAGVAYLMLRRYKDAITILGDMCAVMQRGFKTGALRKLAQSGGGGAGGGAGGGGAGNGAGMLDQFNKQYERMLSLLALLVFSICPSGSASSAAATTMTAAAAAGSSSNSSSSSSSSSNNYFLLEDAVLRVLREKHASQLEAVSSNGNHYDDWFQSPKFICIDPQATSAFRHQVVLFGKEMQPMAAQRKLRSYLKLYTSLPVEKLAKFHDLHAVSEFLPLLLSYKMRMRQIERPAAAAAAVGDENKKGDHNNKSTVTATTAAVVGYTDGAYKTALDIHYYVTTDNVVHMDEAEKQRRFENYFCAQIIQNEEILQDVLAIDTKV